MNFEEIPSLGEEEVVRSLQRVEKEHFIDTLGQEIQFPLSVFASSQFGTAAEEATMDVFGCKHVQGMSRQSLVQLHQQEPVK